MTSHLRRPVMMAYLGGFTLFLIYLGILTLANSFDHAIEQLIKSWYLILPLILGFGVQVGLYSYIQNKFHTRMETGAVASVTTAGGVSTASMVVCCLHHVTDVLPVIGLSAAAVILTEYQSIFMTVGVLSTLVGITIMLGIIQEHELFDKKKKFLAKIFTYNMKRVRKVAVISSVIFFVVFALSMGLFSGVGNEKYNAQVMDLQVRVDDQNGVVFTVRPIDTNKFEIKIDTHQGALDFDLTEISILETSEGEKYRASGWEGSPPGGHHRSGILTFPKIGETERMKLKILDVYDVPERVFKWELYSLQKSERSAPLTYDIYILGGTTAIILVGAFIAISRSRTEDVKTRYEERLQKEYEKLKKKSAKSGLRRKLIIALVAVLIIGTISFTTIHTISLESRVETNMTVKKVLNPEQFSGYVKDAYWVAQTIPTVLMNLDCYCGCEDPAHKPYHRNLYECFTDTHGASCDTCILEALMAYDLQKQSSSQKDIRSAIDKRFKPKGR